MAKAAEGTDLHVAIARLEERTDALEGWQKTQNGSLQRLADRLDRLNWWIVGIAGGVATSMLLLLAQVLARGRS